MAKPRTRNFQTLTPHDSPQSTTAEDASRDELVDWRDSSMDLMRGLDVIELTYDAPVRPRADAPPPLSRERRQRKREPR